MQDLIRVFEGVVPAKHIGPDNDAGGKVAEHSADAQEPADRGSNGGGGQKHDHLKQRRCHAR